MGTQISGSNLSGIDLKGGDFFGTNITYSNITKADFRGSVLVGARLMDVNATDTNWSNARLIGVDAMSTNMNGAKFDGSIIVGSKFSLSQMNGTSFAGAMLRGVTITAIEADPRILDGACRIGDPLHVLAVDYRNKHDLSIGSTPTEVNSTAIGDVAAEVIFNGAEFPLPKCDIDYISKNQKVPRDIFDGGYRFPRNDLKRGSGKEYLLIWAKHERLKWLLGADPHYPKEFVKTGPTLNKLDGEKSYYADVWWKYQQSAWDISEETISRATGGKR